MGKWNVEYTDEFGEWWNRLTEDQQEDFTAIVMLLEEHGPQLPFPHSSGINGSKHAHMRELRVQSGGKPLRSFYAFDPRRTAILLIGGDKTGEDRFYKEMIPVADKLYDDYIAELRKEGLLK
ncbi:MAG TPA: type II toxin-antitoxin system RelE/ParE family toxin [Pseudorhodoplanes sp.]|nr:type II toxin-antitoxin system RelE/ParE family toxin [Pseudorhodoplanes sp.]